MSGVHQPLRFLNGVLDRLTPQRRPQLGDDAISAMGITSILHLQKPPLMGALMSVQKRQPERSADFLLDATPTYFCMMYRSSAFRDLARIHPSLILQSR